jgi:hypothetical protein
MSGGFLSRAGFMFSLFKDILQSLEVFCLLPLGLRQ